MALKPFELVRQIERAKSDLTMFNIISPRNWKAFVSPTFQVTWTTVPFRKSSIATVPAVRGNMITRSKNQKLAEALILWMAGVDTRDTKESLAFRLASVLGRSASDIQLPQRV